ncbi:hypothetical protein [Pedobacter sp. JY14-1]|uniref:hypothetical protein n=1 Tax=Pedobacter sp. JY14-1 TaxID=3034151 RepID=UPI0023E09DB6|nr:hypothetical protein [Pedobacter sp. JY14-1]
MTIPQAIEHLIKTKPRMRRIDLAEAMNLTQGSFLKVMREEKDLPFLAAVKLLDFFKISLEDFVGLLSQEQLDQPEILRIKYAKRLERLREEREIPRTITAEELDQITGRELMASVMEVLRSKMF